MEATAIHKIGDETVAAALSFGDFYQHLTALVRGRTLIVYNAAYDRRILDQTCARYGLSSVRPGGWQCAMLRSAAYVGAWNGACSGYRWHKVGGGDLLALEDSRASLNLIMRMAEAN